ncbi:MAG TPA: multiheme c-type cytochrome, partial [Bryobacterales bacterium]|nr:multiheme c-type cytochrome [Bryobacterales bacterium]
MRGGGRGPAASKRRAALAIGLAALAVAAAGLAKVRILGYRWENPLPYQAPPKGLTSLSAAQCGVCHQEIYQEWLASAHAQALDDRQFHAEMGKEPETGWLCLNCHTPLENQLARIAVAVKAGSAHQPVLETNARFDARLSTEGVTCAVCHVRDGVVLGPWGDSKAPH